MATAAEVGQWIGISARRVGQLRADGVLPGDAGDEYDLHGCVLAYCAHLRPAAGKSARGGSAGAATFDVERGRLAKEQADAQAMKNASMRAEIVTRSEVVAAVGPFASLVRTRMLALPSAAAPIVIGLASLAEVQETLTHMVHNALAEIASAEVVAAAPFDRASGHGRGDGAASGSTEAAPAADR